MHEHKFNPKQIGPFFYDFAKTIQCTQCTQSIRSTHMHTHIYSAHGFIVFMEMDKRECE